MNKGIVAGAALAIIGAGLAAFALSPVNTTYLHAGTGIVAKQLCSLVFVSGLPEAQAREMYINPLLGGAEPLIRAEVDAAEGEVRASVLGLGLWGKRAVLRDGLGCTLVHGDPEAGFDPALALPGSSFEPMALDIAHRDAHFDVEALEAAVTAAFADGDGGARNTLAVVVLHEGRLVAERYGPNVDAATPLHGWSMSKSLAATLAGVMVEDGLVDLHAQDAVPALSLHREDSGDVTIDALLRMAGGFAIAERNDGFDPNSRMLFAESDMARFAATRERLHPPLAHWEYMSGNTILATHALQGRMGATLPDQIAYVRRELFAPLDIGSAVFEADEAGTLQGSSYAYLAAQDWARLAQLYVDDGRAPDGTRLLPEGFADYVVEPTDGSDGTYGVGFWIIPKARTGGATVFYMSGFQGQYGFIVPERELVVVRLGATNSGSPGAYELLSAVAAAERREPPDAGGEGGETGEAEPESEPVPPAP